MKVQHTYCCEASGCDIRATSTTWNPTEGVSLTERKTGHVMWACSWDCVLKIAGNIPPMEEVR